MGIQGLLPFLEKSTRRTNISEFSGCTVAVDAYVWLHKGAFSCADKLARGEDTDQYVFYCLKFINMLLTLNIKPILVFDGQHLPAKADTEKVRRERREESRRKAAELLRMDRGDEARNLIRRCVDVTHAMALALIKKCREMNVDCIVAPFEADAQLAYLNIHRIAHLVITEDSDLLLFGCPAVMFKMDLNGNGVVIEQDRLHIALKMRPEHFSLDKFRYMCILSGCDYLPSLPGIGLTKACRFITRTQDDNISRALTRMGGHLNMPSLSVSQEYRDKFLEADRMFKYQPVFDPRTRQIVHLTPLPEGEIDPLPVNLDRETAFQLALGNLDPFSHRTVDQWDPDKPQPLGKSWKNRAPHPSIWSKDFKLPTKKYPKHSEPVKETSRASTKGKQVVHSVEKITQKIVQRPTTPPVNIEEELEILREMYTVSSPPAKKQCLATEEEEGMTSVDDLIEESPVKQPKNPFKILKSPQGKQESALATLSKIRKTSVDETVVVQSRYFSSEPEEKPPERPSSPEVTIDSILGITSDESPLPSPIHPRNIFSIQRKEETKSDFETNFGITKSKGFLSIIDSVSRVGRSSVQWSKSNEEEDSSSTNETVTSAISNVYIETPPSSQEPAEKKSGGCLVKAKVPLTPLVNARRIGLSKKSKVTVKTKSIKTPDKSQPSLLTMFAFQAKPKLT